MKAQSFAACIGASWRRAIRALAAAAALTSINAAPALKVALLQPAQIDHARLLFLKNGAFTSVSMALTETNVAEATAAGQRIATAGFELDYWIEIGRNPAFADAHPEWMASIQTHDEWRHRFPDLEPTPSNAVVKVYPWTPALYQETFQPHLDRVRALLRTLPAPRRLFLNDLQGAPSACGCGHPLCRWTTDYGPLKTATRLPDRAAADFVAAVKRFAPGSEIIPVWTTECEQADRDTVCGGVGCYTGACWREWTAQLQPVAVAGSVIGVLLPYRAFDRDLPRYGKPAGWIHNALKYFQTMPGRYGKDAVPVRQLLPVIQGWDVTSEQLATQLERVKESGAAGVVVAFSEIDQSWTPQVISLGPPKAR